MIWLFIVLAVYMVGVISCRKMMCKYQEYYDPVDIAICFAPILHWAYMIMTYIENIDSNWVDRFFSTKGK